MPADHLEGVSGYQYNDYIGLGIEKDDGYLELENRQKEKIVLPFKQIVSVNFVTWEKTITKALNPLAEGIAITSITTANIIQFINFTPPILRN